MGRQVDGDAGYQKTGGHTWTSLGWAGVVTILIVFYWSGSRDRRERRREKRKKTQGMIFSRHTSSKQQAKVNSAKKGKAALPRDTFFLASSKSW